MVLTHSGCCPRARTIKQLCCCLLRMDDFITCYDTIEQACDGHRKGNEINYYVLQYQFLIQCGRRIILMNLCEEYSNYVKCHPVLLQIKNLTV